MKRLAAFVAALAVTSVGAAAAGNDMASAMGSTRSKAPSCITFVDWNAPSGPTSWLKCGPYFHRSPARTDRAPLHTGGDGIGTATGAGNTGSDRF